MPAPPDPIDRLLSLDLGSRGIAGFFVAGGAAAAARALARARRVLIATGFAVAPDTAETDGPPGAAVLGRALRLSGARVAYVTDAPAAPILEAALKTLDEPVAIDVYPDADDAAASILASRRPTHLVSVERPGRTERGEYLNLRGRPVDRWNRPIDEIFLLNQRRPAARRARTIGIGDGGNEIGMGTVKARVAREGALFARIASVVRVDHLVVAGTSNWGAYGVVAALGRLARRDLLHTPAMEHRLVEACIAAGAVDGVTRRREPTVDGLPLEAHAAIVSLLRVAACDGAPGRAV